MRRWIAAVLACCLTGSAFAGAAAPSQDEKLAAITKQVKQQIMVSDVYTEFEGTLEQDALETTWDLRWSGNGETLSVTALDDGTIISLYRWREEAGSADTGAVPTLSKATAEETKRAAQQFLNRVLRAHETVRFREDQQETVPISGQQAYLYGKLCYDAVPTPVSLHVSVDPDTMEIMQFNRARAERVGGIPSAKAAVPQTAVADKLHGTVKLELVYTTQEEEKGKAALRYVPMPMHTYYADAQSGALIDLTAIQKELNARGAGADNEKSMLAGDSAADGALTSQEQAGADRLKGALSGETLDGKLRAMPELGLAGFTTAGSRFSVDTESGDVTCFLRYTKGKDEDAVFKFATVDAKTGDLRQLSTSYNQEKTGSSYAGDAGQQKAEAFLQKYQKELFGMTAPYVQEDTDSSSYRYARQENGYPFPENYFSVRINTETGLVDDYEMVWTESVEFAEPGQLISAERAQQAYLDAAYGIELRYVPVPVKLKPSMPRYEAYNSLGYAYLDEWKLGYQLQNKPGQRCIGLDANSAEPVYQKGGTQTQALQYSDVDAAVYPQILALAEQGVGYTGGEFQPEKALTQEDLVMLLLSTDRGSWADGQDAEKRREELYNLAYQRGILTRAAYAPDQVLTRATLVKMMVTAVGYGKTADLPIYRCSFTDEASIPQDAYGYVATAQGLGIIKGDEKGRFEPNETATRAQAAIILYNYMTR